MSNTSWISRMVYRITIVQATLVIGLIGCGRQPESPRQSSLAVSPSAKVNIVQPQRKSVRCVVEQPGTVQAYEETQLYARVPGYVSRVFVDIGQKVIGPKYSATGKEMEPGQVLAEVAVPELEQETNLKQAVTRQAEAEEDQAQQALVSAEANIAMAEAAVLEATALRDRWESESKRIAKLVESGTIDIQSRDETKNQFRAAEAHVLSTEAAVRKAKADRDKMSADVRAAEAKVNVAKADALRSQAMLAYARIRAPYNGVVTSRRVNTGDLVQPSGGKGEWLFSVARLDPVRVVVAVPEADAELVRDQAEATLNIRAAQSSVLHGTVSRISWSLEPGARTLRTEIDLPNQDSRLRPGMYVYAQIDNHCPDCWTLPVSAVLKQGDALVCFLIDGGKAVRTPVQVGRTDGQIVEVLKRQSPGSLTSWTDWTGKEFIADHAAGLSDGQMTKTEIVQANLALSDAPDDKPVVPRSDLRADNHVH